MTCLKLQRAQEAVDAQAVPEVVVRGREPRAPPRARADGSGARSAHPGRTRAGRTVAAAGPRARRSVPGTGSRSRAARAGSRCCRPVPPAGARPRRRRDPGGPPPRRPGARGRAGQAGRPAWQKRPSSRAPDGPDAECSTTWKSPCSSGLLTVGHDRGRHLERVGKRRDTAGADGGGLGRLDGDLAPAGGERAGELAEQERVAAGPRDGLVLDRGPAAARPAAAPLRRPASRIARTRCRSPRRAPAPAGPPGSRSAG